MVATRKTSMLARFMAPWVSVGQRVIYAAETYAGALLEVLVHANLSQPPQNHRVIRIDIPG